MSMVGIGIGEMILIAGIALVVFGPEKFPDFAKIVLRTVRDLRGYVDEIQKEVSKEIKPIKRELDKMSKYDPEKYIDALSKDITGEKKTPSSTPSTTQKTAADPTDRQDDSFDYDYGAGSNQYDADPYNNQEIVSEQADNTPEGASSQSEQSKSAQEADANTAGGAEFDGQNEPDEDDFSKPPVERLD